MLRVLCAITLGALTACTCGTRARDQVYACTADEECADGFACVSGVCTEAGGAGGGSGGGSGGGPAGGSELCTPGGAPRACAVAGCEQLCEDTGTWGACTPIAGGDLSRNRLHCGACGVACSDAYGGILDCVNGSCTCATDADCGPGKICSISGLCTDPAAACASAQCDAGTVCRGTSCAIAACDQGCRPGELCDLTTGLCRYVSTCRLPVACSTFDGGVCEGPLKPDGTPCNDADPCTFGETCLQGACSGTPYTCSGTPGICQTSVTCAGDGGCAGVPAPDGTLCSDGNLCTHSDGCRAGACTGTTYVCAPNICASASSCDGDGGCITTAQNEGAACDDANLCSVVDVCVMGTCAGSPYTCPPPRPCDEQVACTGDGGCLVMPKANGAACDDGEVCTANDTCTNDVCSGSTTTTYRDLDGDGRGDLNISAMTCPAPAGYVAVGGDCNDSDPDVFTFVQNLLKDNDGDGRTVGAPMGQCVGDAPGDGGTDGGTAYRDADGGLTWLTPGASLGTDCDDGDSDVYDVLMSAVTDADHDGHHAGAPGMVCAGAASTANGRTYYANAAGAPVYLLAADALGSAECNDANASVYRTVTAAQDADQDGYVVPNSSGAQCVGASAVVSGRTYYAGSAGLLVWLTDPPLGTDCNDLNAMVSGPFPWFYDSDRDTFGGPSMITACSQPDAGFVTVGGDCNDTNLSVYRDGISVVPDDDRDGYKNSGSAASTTACIGAQSTFSGRTYYKATTGADTWLASTMSLGDDCDGANPSLFASMPSMVTDADNDGYYAGAAATACVGTSSIVNGRTYYRNAAGALVYLASASALGGGECNDSDADVYRTVTAGTDVDQDGYIVAGSSASQCVGASMLVGGRTYYADLGGQLTRLGGTPLGDDCNDANAGVSGPFPWYFDGDGDGTGGAMSMISCSSPGAGYVTAGNDCDDGNGSIYRVVTVGLVVDADRDGWRVMGGVVDTSECVGVTTTNGGRTYYRNALGADTWLTASQALGDDCNDASAAVGGAASWYADTDGDGFGGGVPLVQCSQPAGYVSNGTDCLNTDADVYRNIANLYDDTDRDGYHDSVQGIGTRCVGLSQVFSGRTYYRATSGLYTWTPTSLGIDCLDTNANVFQVQSNLLNDDDNDGYPYPNDNDFSACAGSSTFISGRQYYIGPSGSADYIDERDCIGRQGNNCPNIDCYDQNANARPGQLTYFTSQRGDGSFDYDCSGAISNSPTAGTYCTSISSQTFYTDASCLSGAATANLCSGPVAFGFGSSASCGRNTLGTSGFYNPGVCTAASRASTTVVGCR